MQQVTFTGRLVQGDPHAPQPQGKDDRTGQLKVRKNGDPDRPYYVAVAVPKNPVDRFTIQGLPSYEEEKAKVDADARAAWPEFFGPRPAGLAFGEHLAPDCKNPKFSNKIIDGDGFDDKGNPFSRHEGWGGCWVIKATTYYAPQVEEWRDDQVDGRGQLLKPDWYACEKTGRTIKLGDFVSVTMNSDSNKSNDSPGMYMNLTHVGFEKEGERITPTGSNAVDASQVLGSRGGPSGGNAGAASGSNGAAGGQTSTTASGATSYSGYRTGAAGGDDTPPPPGAADETPPPPPAGPTMTAKANGKSFESFIAAGWTEAQLREHGYVA